MTVQYQGGPLMIDQTDAALFRQLLQGTVVANDDFGNPINFTPFRTAGGCGGLGSGNHYLNIHATTVPITIEDNPPFSPTPPRPALLSDDRKRLTSGVSKGIPQKYLIQAGPHFPGAQGGP